MIIWENGRGTQEENSTVTEAAKPKKGRNEIISWVSSSEVFALKKSAHWSETMWTKIGNLNIHTIIIF